MRANRPIEGQMEDTLRRAAAVLTRGGDEFLPAVVTEVARTLGAGLVFIGELVPDGQVRTVAVSRNGVAAENFSYCWAGSATEPLARDATSVCPSDAGDRYPLDQQVAVIGAQSMVAVRICDSKNGVIGVLAAMLTRPLTSPDEGTALLQILAGRIGAELQRARSEQELRESEAHLRQVQQIEAVGRLAGGIAHDFNNLLMIMTGYAEILRQRHGPSREIVELIAASSRATTLTRQLLAYGRRQVLHIERLNLNEVVEQVRTMLAPVISAAVTLETSLDAALPAVDADRGQFEQLIVNLALNARDAMPDGGSLTLSTRTERLTRPYHQMPAGLYVCLDVSDTGVGMTEDVKAQIFEPFYTTKGARGSGLGLSSVYGVVKQSNGFIWCNSTPGAGTTFTIYLRPSSAVASIDAAPASERECRPSAALDARPTVLVVDDEVPVRRWVSRILRARGYDVVDVEDGAAALALMRDARQRPALVMTDIVMPGVNGTRLAEDIERQWPGTRLLFVSGFAGSASVRASAMLARVPVLQKPFTPEQVISAVRDALDAPPPAGAPSSCVA